MNYYAFLLSTIYHAKEIDLEGQKFQIKPRSEWKKSAVCFLFGTILSLLVFLLLSKVPYAGPVFFLAGFAGFLYCLVFCIRDFLVFKDFDNIFTEENIRKIADK